MIFNHERCDLAEKIDLGMAGCLAADEDGKSVSRFQVGNQHSSLLRCEGSVWQRYGIIS